MAVFGSVLQCAGLALVLGALVVDVPMMLMHGKRRINTYAFYCIGNFVCGIGAVIDGVGPLAGLNFAVAALNAWLWFNKRKRRKRALRALGSKAKVRLAALVRKSREAAQPRPVLRPVPGGAR